MRITLEPVGGEAAELRVFYVLGRYPRDRSLRRVIDRGRFALRSVPPSADLDELVRAVVDIAPPADGWEMRIRGVVEARYDAAGAPVEAVVALDDGEDEPATDDGDAEVA